MAVYNACLWLITIAVVWIYDFTNAGHLSLAMGITNIFYCIGAYNIRAYQVSDIKNEYSDGIYIVSRIFTSACAMALCAIFVLLSGYREQQIYIILCYMGFRCFEIVSDALHGVVHKYKRLDYVGISMSARGVLMLAAFCVLGLFFELRFAIFGMVVTTAMVCLLYDLPKAKKQAVFKPCSVQGIWNLLKQCFPLMLVVLMITFYVSYTRYSLERTHGTEILGAYTSTTAPAVIMQLTVSFLLAPLMNVFAEYVKNSDKTGFLKSFFIASAIITGCIVIMTTVAYLAGQWGLELIFGTIIAPYAYLLTGAVIATGFTALLWFMNIVFSALRDIKGIFIGCLAGVAVCIMVTDIFINKYGPIGANYSLIICQGVALIVLFIRLLSNVNTIFDKKFNIKGV